MKPNLIQTEPPEAMNPRSLAEEMEADPRLPAGAGERFRGYGVIGLPFDSGHVLAFRRISASSLGPAYTTVWHRDPAGCWTFFTDVDPELSCPRFFSAALTKVVPGEVGLSWDGPFDLSMRVPEAGLQWGVRLSSDLRTGALSAVGRMMPGPLWRADRVLGAAGAVAGRVLGVGKLALSGTSPNGQGFQAASILVWRVAATAAMLDREDLGRIAPLHGQARLGDFWIPNGGLFAFGESRFQDLDPHRRGTDPGSVRAGARDGSGRESAGVNP
jgi:hypothetical protein